MTLGGKFLTAAAVLAIAGCTANTGELNIRSLATPLAQGERPVSFRVAEARAQFALGNVALALEGFRKAQREEPASIDAVLGIAACYDRMGRFDLSDRYFQMALAVDPVNRDALTALAASLELQGRRAEAAEVRREIATALADAGSAGQPIALAAVNEAPTPQADVQPPLDRLASVAQAITAAAESVAVAKPPAASVTINLSETPAPVAGAGVSSSRHGSDRAPADGRARLERTSLAEVALITRGGPAWKSEVVSQSRISTTVRFVPMQAQVQREASIRLLNAARVHRLAARTRSLLAEVGWTKMTVGDAPSTRRRSLILYPASERAAAERIAARFGFLLARSSGIDRITVYLGHDAVPMVAKRA